MKKEKLNQDNDIKIKKNKKKNNALNYEVRHALLWKLD